MILSMFRNISHLLKNLNKHLIPCFFLLSGSSFALDQIECEPSVTSQKIQMVEKDIDRIYSHHRQAHNIPGLIYGIVVDGKLSLCNAQGISKINTKEIPNETSAFRIASMTKSFTAMAIVQLRDRGILALDNPVEEYVPEVKKIFPLSPDAPKLTIRHLLTMQSGLPQDDPWGDRLLDISDQDLRCVIGNGLHLANPPATLYEYSNIGYGILGLIITTATGEPYQTYITENILRPLGMKNTHFEFNDVPTNQLVPGYRYEDGIWKLEPLLHDGAMGAMGGIITTVEDFTKYVAFHQSAWPAGNDSKGNSYEDIVDHQSRPVSSSTLREMHSPVCHISTSMATTLSTPPVVIAVSKGYGYGLECNHDSRGVYYVRHAGGLPGFSCEWRFLPEYGVGIVAFANRSYASMTVANNTVMDYLVDNNIISQKDTPKVFDSFLEACGRKLADIITHHAWSGKTKMDDDNKLFALNFFLDKSRRSRAREISEIVDSIGGLESVSAIEAINNLRGFFFLNGKSGQKVKVFYTMTPENEPRIQEVKFE